MEESQATAVPEDRTETILEKEKNSEGPMDQPQTSLESGDPSASGCESTTEAESENQLRLFVTLLTVRVLTKCHALQNRSHEELVAHTKRLLNQTMEGLAITEGFCPDMKSTKKVCKAVLKDLDKKFCRRHLLESLILLQDPVVDAAIIESMQAHVKELSARLAEKATSHSFWKDLLQVVAFTAGLLAIFFLMALIP